ncbi:MAG TPA: amidase, partial [Tepidiformaceae bacterium]|nr:amidase [Tepidiformaceae bacterium]
MTDLPLTITEAAAAFRSGKLTSVALTEAMFAAADRIDPLVGVYITRSDVTALAAARQADADFAAGIDKGPLQGIPIGVKDIIATKDAPTTAQSQVLDPWWGSGYDAPVVARLRDAGAVIMGKTTTMEFAIGAPDAAKPFPVPRNPWNLERWPGGSSSGSGSGVSAGLFLGALGTDTGGSIRGPASFCGISGMKQTFGRVPKSGCVSLGYSYDHIGPMARSAMDCAIMLKVIAGHDPSDLTSVDEPVPDYPSFLTGSVAGMKIGIDRAGFLTHPNQEPEVVDVFEAAITALANAGAEIIE